MWHKAGGEENLAMFSHNFTEKKREKVLAVCDKDLLGKVLSDEDRTFKVKEEFYGDKSISQDTLLEKASQSTIINAVGNKVVSLLVENGFFDEEKILKIDGVPHAQMVKI